MDKIDGDANENAVARATKICVDFSERRSKGRKKGERQSKAQEKRGWDP